MLGISILAGQACRLPVVPRLQERPRLIQVETQKSWAIPTMRRKAAVKQSQAWVTRWENICCPQTKWYYARISRFLASYVANLFFQVSDDINEMVEQIQAIQHDISELAGRPISLVGGSKRWKDCCVSSFKDCKDQDMAQLDVYRWRPKWKLW